MHLYQGDGLQGGCLCWNRWFTGWVSQLEQMVYRVGISVGTDGLQGGCLRWNRWFTGWVSLLEQMVYRVGVSVGTDDFAECSGGASSPPCLRLHPALPAG